MLSVVVGCGKVGSLLAQRLTERGEDVAVIDEDPTAFDRLGSGFNGTLVHGKGVDTQILRQAGVEEAGALVAVTSQDNVNIVIAQIAERLFHVPLVLCRVHDVAKEEIYRGQGMETISPTRLAANQLLRRIAVGATITDGLPNGYEWEDVPVQGQLVGRTIAEAEHSLKGRVLFVFRGQETRLAQADMTLGAKDVLAVVSRIDTTPRSRESAR